MTSVEHNPNDDITIELIKDHDELREMFGKLRGGATGKEREDLVREMTVELVKHSVSEEVVLYPLVRRVLDGGDQLADSEIAEHAEVEQLLKELERLDSDTSEYADKVTKVIDDVTSHAKEEEDVLFPQLREKCDADELKKLGDRVRGVKKIAPTHPHPHAPDTPPGNLIAGPLAGLVDRVRDVFSGGA